MDTATFADAPVAHPISTQTKRRIRTIAAALPIALIMAGCQQTTSEPQSSPTPLARQEVPEKDHFTMLPDQIRWITPPPSAAFLPEGVEVAFIEGLPPIPGPFTFRLKFPPGSRLMPHTHPAIEKLTVISGTLHQGLGEKFDQAATETVPAGGFSYRAPGIAHFVWFDEETVLQFHGTGPFDLTYVNPADDPRNKK